MADKKILKHDSSDSFRAVVCLELANSLVLSLIADAPKRPWHNTSSLLPLERLQVRLFAYMLCSRCTAKKYFDSNLNTGLSYYSLSDAISYCNGEANLRLYELMEVAIKKEDDRIP